MGTGRLLLKLAGLEAFKFGVAEVLENVVGEPLRRNREIKSRTEDNYQASVRQIVVDEVKNLGLINECEAVAETKEISNKYGYTYETNEKGVIDFGSFMKLGGHENVRKN